MSEPQTQFTQPTHDTASPVANTQPSLSVIVNPEDTIGLMLEPAFISLGLPPEYFFHEVGGTV